MRSLFVAGLLLSASVTHAEDTAPPVEGVLAWQSWRYIQLTIEFEDTVLVNMPAWIAYGLLPLSFALMCYRFILLSGSTLMRIFRPEADEDIAE